MQIHKIAIVLILAALLSACAPATRRMAVDDAVQAVEAQKQREIALAVAVKDTQRLGRVSSTILVGAAELCGEDIKPYLGMDWRNKYGYGKEMADAAAKLYQLSDPLQIVLVNAGSPSDKAGLKKGDILIGMDDIKAPSGEGATESFGKSFTEYAATHDKLTVKVQRNGKNMEIPVQTVKRCAFDAMISPTDIINAFADGKHITITKGMMRFAQDDTELELVIAHELAHNAMKHMDKKRGNQFLGAIIDGLLGARGIQTGGAFGNMAGGSYSQDFEAEADYVGLYMMARAGGNIEEAPKFWRRMAAENPGAIGDRNSSHPSTPYRFTALEKTVLEIRDKQKAGVSVMPEMKDGKPYMEAVVKETANP